MWDSGEPVELHGLVRRASRTTSAATRTTSRSSPRTPGSPNAGTTSSRPTRASASWRSRGIVELAYGVRVELRRHSGDLRQAARSRRRSERSRAPRASRGTAPARGREPVPVVTSVAGVRHAGQRDEVPPPDRRRPGQFAGRRSLPASGSGERQRGPDRHSARHEGRLVRLRLHHDRVPFPTTTASTSPSSMRTATWSRTSSITTSSGSNFGVVAVDRQLLQRSRRRRDPGRSGPSTIAKYLPDPPVPRVPEHRLRGTATTTPSRARSTSMRCSSGAPASSSCRCRRRSGPGRSGSRTTTALRTRPIGPRSRSRRAPIPNGWLFGLDITLSELLSQVSFGVPFAGTLDSARVLVVHARERRSGRDRRSTPSASSSGRRSRLRRPISSSRSDAVVRNRGPSTFGGPRPGPFPRKPVMKRLMFFVYGVACHASLSGRLRMHGGLRRQLELRLPPDDRRPARGLDRDVDRHRRGAHRRVRAAALRDGAAGLQEPGGRASCPSRSSAALTSSSRASW